jgi:hypothetical protein
MWVRVTGRDADGYAGVLDNVPSVPTTIKVGDTLRFGPQHVISVAATAPPGFLPGFWPGTALDYRASASMMVVRGGRIATRGRSAGVMRRGDRG